MASRFKTVTIEEVTKLKEAAENLNTRMSIRRIRKVFFVKKLRKLRTLAKMYALNENSILLNVLDFRYNKPVKTITVVSVICHPRH